MSAGTINACLTMLKQWGVKRIKVLSIIASKPGTHAVAVQHWWMCSRVSPPFTCPLAGLAALHKAHPDVQVHVAAVDNELNEVGSWCWCRACLVLNLTTCCRRHIRTRTLYPALAMWETACGAPCKAPRQQATPLPRVLAPAMQVLVARSAPVRRKSVVVRAVAYAAVRAK